MVEHVRPNGGEAGPNAGILEQSEWGERQEEGKEEEAGGTNPVGKAS